MGYFALCVNDKNELDLIQNAITNLDLYLKTSNNDYNYLLEICKEDLNKLQNLLSERMLNGNFNENKF